MHISLLTDAPKHNLALMKLSTYHKQLGDEVTIHQTPSPPRILLADLSYASVLFEWNYPFFTHADLVGGPAAGFAFLEPAIEKCKPDYSLFDIDYSLGYTFRPCFNTCNFCKVPNMHHPDVEHHSIWEFHNTEFDTICLLNNNTFQDPKWKETFKEIWDADLKLRDENGYDLRLLDDEKAEALHRTKKANSLHFAWDRMADEALIVRGLKLLTKYRMRRTANGVYVLIGYNTTEDEDLYRCQIIHNHGLTPYPMPYIDTPYTKAFKRFINLHYYRKYETIKDAWLDYERRTTVGALK